MHASGIDGGEERSGLVRERIEQLALDFAALPVRILHHRLIELRHLADELGWMPLSALARRFEDALGEGGHRIAGAALLPAMRDAAQLGRGDAATGHALVASVNSRLIG